MANVLPAGFEDEFSDDSDDYGLSYYQHGKDLSEPKSFEENTNETNQSKQFDTSETWQNGESWNDSSNPIPQRIPVVDLSSKLMAKVEFPIDDLRIAILNGDLTTVQYFIENGTDVNVKLKGNWTPLLYASSAGHPEIVHYLLEQNASPDYNHVTDRFFPLMAACTSDKDDENSIMKCVTLLLEHGAKVDSMDRYHTTPLMYSAKRGHLSVLIKLLDFYADPNVTDSQGWSALFHAANSGHMSLVVELMKTGADTKLRDHRRHSAADIAYLRSFEEIAAYIDDSYKDTGEKTPLAAKTNDNKITSIANRSSSYSQLELFLYGLHLQSTIEDFKEHNITFNQLLTLTEDDLEKIGIQQIGSRKKLVEAIRAVHQMEWETSSLMKIHYDQSITCSDATAMLANISKHALYMTSTIVYIGKQIELHPCIVEETNDTRLLEKFLHYSSHSMKNVNTLLIQLEKFNKEIKTLLADKNLQPVEIISAKDNNLLQERTSGMFSFPNRFGWKSLCLASVALIAAVSFWRREISRTFALLPVIEIRQLTKPLL
ncbi:ankyrin repeat, SAM and basic leucine zipper domain-containing protein 1 [Octopus sinensis]|uniref:Ankyrin repeat, SAM and basic leucine zipper domain-containing protein 1 n=1 Tax=Octopus sinensis TaxID=2607531 RepID=A0A6P7T8A5_9MOLL|nr:ankyrin repeat, SAM and basic leucine zipper domain-containing protein 1 [Octopus sinensis]